MDVQTKLKEEEFVSSTVQFVPREKGKHAKRKDAQIELFREEFASNMER